MKVTMKSRILAMFGAVTLVTVIACADSPTSPTPSGARAPRDTTIGGGDTTMCRSGWVTEGGKVICNREI